MAVRTDPSRAPRTPLSRERVLRAAIALADAGGIDGLTMRKLAQELGVEAMSLYHHVAGKEEILAGMVDLVVSEIDAPSGEGDWKTAVRRSALSFHAVLMRHPWSANLLLSPARVSQARLRHMDLLLGRLRDAGFSAEMTHHAYHALDSHVMGFTLWLAGMALDARKLPDMAAAFLRDLPRDEFPWLEEHIQTHVVEPVEYQGTEFEFGLDLILDGLDGMRANGSLQAS